MDVEVMFTFHWPTAWNILVSDGSAIFKTSQHTSSYKSHLFILLKHCVYLHYSDIHSKLLLSLEQVAFIFQNEIKMRNYCLTKCLTE